MGQEANTRGKILETGKREFLSKGFLAASLRNNVKEAGVTTGAFYGYFSSKEALFAALVEPHAAAVMGRFIEAQSNLPTCRRAGNLNMWAGSRRTVCCGW